MIWSDISTGYNQADIVRVDESGLDWDPETKDLNLN